MRNKILEFSFLPQGVNEMPKNVVDIQYSEQNFKLFFKGLLRITSSTFHEVCGGIEFKIFRRPQLHLIILPNF